jgi:hypothetical protein
MFLSDFAKPGFEFQSFQKVDSCRNRLRILAFLAQCSPIHVWSCGFDPEQPAVEASGNANLSSIRANPNMNEYSLNFRDLSPFLALGQWR